MSKKKLEKLNNYLNSGSDLSDAQKEVFTRMYPKGSAELKGTKLDWAITQCENTIKKNKVKAIEIKKLFSEQPDEIQTEILKEIPSLLTSIFDSTMETKYQEVLQKILEQKVKKLELMVKNKEKTARDLLPKTSKVNQRADLKSFGSMDEAIDSYNEDAGELFDCGQGFYQEEATDFAYVEDTLYQVKITAEISSQKQDRGDRLYWVEKITSVSFVPFSEKDLDLINKKTLANEVTALEAELELKKKKLNSL